MKINNKLEKAINDQINLEWATAYELIGKSAYLENTPFKGFAKWMRKRGERELEHATQLFEFLRNRSGVLELSGLKKADTSFKSPLKAFQSALEEKGKVVEATHKLYELAVELKDIETEQLLHAFIDEQTNEVKHIFDTCQKIEFANDQPDAMLHLDYKEEKSAEA